MDWESSKMHHRERDFSADRIQGAIQDGINRDGKPDLTEAQRLLNAAFLNLPSEKFNKIANELEERNSDFKWQKEDDERRGTNRYGSMASGLGDVSVHRDRHGNVVAMVINDSKGWSGMGADIVGTRIFDAGNPKMLDTGRVAQHRIEYASTQRQENVVSQSMAHRIEVRPLPPPQRVMAPEMMMPPDQYSRALRQDIVDTATYTIKRNDNWLVIAQKVFLRIREPAPTSGTAESTRTEHREQPGRSTTHSIMQRNYYSSILLIQQNPVCNL
jgi:hypothetical protein